MGALGTVFSLGGGGGEEGGHAIFRFSEKRNADNLCNDVHFSTVYSIGHSRNFGKTKHQRSAI